jgi:hypothetical protein
MAWAVMPVLAGPEAVRPPSLSQADTVYIAAGSCFGKAQKEWSIKVPAEVAELRTEFEELRRQHGDPAAAKFSCKVKVSFSADGQPITIVYVLGCTAFERAPVEGKRYFFYKRGLSQLPG